MKMLSTGLLAVALAAGAGGCSSTLRYTPHGTARVPEADVTITADRNQDQHTAMVNVKVEHLAPPDRVSPACTAFIVWSRPDASTAWNRVGMLNYSTADRKGELQATVPFTRFELIITAESVAGSAAPSENIVVSQIVGA